MAGWLLDDPLGYWAVGLFGYWAIGLLGYWALGLIGYVVNGPHGSLTHRALPSRALATNGLSMSLQS